MSRLPPKKRSPSPVKVRPSAVRLPEGYGQFLDDLKRRIVEARLRATLAVSRELLTLYWRTGRDIVLRQKTEGWGSAVIERLASDLRVAFPGVSGFSASNIWRMRAFYLAYAGERGELLAQPARVIRDDLPSSVVVLPWGHLLVLIEKVKDPAARAWYARMALEHGWSRNVLFHHIETERHRRDGQAQTNFAATLPPLQSDLAERTLKDPYVFDFLSLSDQAQERDLERALTTHIRDFLLELGVGFAFVGSQVHVELGGEDYYIDLLFYHLKLRSYVVVELKTGAFRPEFAGKISFYLSAVDDLLRHPDDKPSIGIILCRERSKIVVEYALRDKKPIGVAEYRLTGNLPEALKGSLPTVDEIEANLSEH